LREKPGAERIETVVGDMAATHVEGDFSLVYLVFNTIFNLTTQEGQIACFENAAAHLPSGGRFARLAGMRLEQRWVGWAGEPFTGLSPSHVSAYQKP